jgi:hypothetical protein
VSATTLSVSVPLPAGFTVLWTADGGATDPVDEELLEAAQQEWLTTVRERSACAPGVVLCAVHVELWQGEPVTASLVMSVEAAGLGPDGLHEWALDRTSTAGEVSQLQLARGRAVRTVDVVTVGPAGDPAPGSAGVVEVHLPEAAPGLLLSLVLTTQHLEVLGAYAALLADTAAGVEVEVGSPPAGPT